MTVKDKTMCEEVTENNGKITKNNEKIRRNTTQITGKITRKNGIVSGSEDVTEIDGELGDKCCKCNKIIEKFSGNYGEITENNDEISGCNVKVPRNNDKRTTDKTKGNNGNITGNTRNTGNAGNASLEHMHNTNMAVLRILAQDLDKVRGERAKN